MRVARPLVGSLFAAALVAAAPPGRTQDAAPSPSWAAVAAIFERSCVHCHGGDRPVAGLSLATHEALRAGARGTPVVVAGAPERSPLVARLRGRELPGMPFDAGPLPEAEIALVEAWIQAGAPGPVPAAAPKPPPAPAPAAPAPSGPVAPAAGSPDAPPSEDRPLRWRDVRALLRAACVRCHQPKGLRGGPPEGIRLDSYEALVGGARVVVVPGRAEASPLVRAVEGRARKRMPLDGPPWLRPEETALLARWVREGARGDDGVPAAAPVGREVRLWGPWDGAGRVDRVSVVVNASTRVDAGVASDVLVEVRATVAADGSLVASRVRPRATEPTEGGDDHGGRGGGRDDGPGDDHGGRGRGRDDGPGDDHGGRGRGRDDG